MRQLLQYPWFFFLAGVFVTFALLVGVLFIADALRKKRIKKSGAPSDPVGEQNKAPQKSYESFRNIATGVNSIAVPILLILGGAWTFYTFSQTRQLKFTQLQLEKLELDKAKVQEDMRGYFQIQFDLKATQLNFPNAKNAPRYIRVDVRWSNAGNWVPKERTYIDFKKGEFKLIRVEGIARDGDLEFYDLVQSERALKLRLGLERGLVGSTVSGHFSDFGSAIQLVTVPGIYMIWISAQVGDWKPGAVTFIDVK